jgi:hypothetical protein
MVQLARSSHEVPYPILCHCKNCITFLVSATGIDQVLKVFAKERIVLKQKLRSWKHRLGFANFFSLVRTTIYKTWA